MLIVCHRHQIPHAIIEFTHQIDHLRDMRVDLLHPRFMRCHLHRQPRLLVIQTGPHLIRHAGNTHIQRVQRVRQIVFRYDLRLTQFRRLLNQPRPRRLVPFYRFPDRVNRVIRIANKRQQPVVEGILLATGLKPRSEQQHNSDDKRHRQQLYRIRL